MLKRTTLFFTKAVIAIGLLYFVWKAGFIDTAAIKGLFDFRSISLLISLVLASVLLMGIRSYYLIHCFGKSIRLIRAVKLTFIGNFFNYCIPGGTGGDIVKALMLAQEIKVPRWHAVGIVFVDRVMGLFTICLLSLLAMLYYFQKTIQSQITAFIFLSVFSLVFMAILFYLITVYFPAIVSDKWKFTRALSRSQFLARTRQGLGFQNMLVPLALSLCSHLLIIFSIYYSTVLFSLDIFSLGSYLIVVPVGLALSSLPITPAGIGVAQVAFFTLFKIYTGIESGTPATAVSIYQIVFFLVSLLGMYFYVASDFKILKTEIKSQEGASTND